MPYIFCKRWKISSVTSSASCMLSFSSSYLELDVVYMFFSYNMCRNLANSIWSLAILSLLTSWFTSFSVASRFFCMLASWATRRARARRAAWAWATPPLWTPTLNFNGHVWRGFWGKMSSSELAKASPFVWDHLEAPASPVEPLQNSEHRSDNTRILENICRWQRQSLCMRNTLTIRR